MTRAHLLVPLVAACALAAACSAAQADVCDDLRGRLETCGLPSRDLACNGDRLGMAEAVLERLEAEGCKGAFDEDGAVDRRLCDIAAWPCPGASGPAATGGKKTRYPVVFVSGLTGGGTFDWSPRIVEAVSELTETHLVNLPGWTETSERAAELWASLERFGVGREGRKVNLVCWAVGGLDCRFLVSERGLFAGDRATLARAQGAVASITTVATPHRGTRVAEAALALVESETSEDILRALAGPEGGEILPSRSAVATTLRGLTEDALADLDARLPDAQGIFYQSWAGVSRVRGIPGGVDPRATCTPDEGASLFDVSAVPDPMHEALWVTAPFAGAPTDGMVAVASARHGLFRGCLPGDHYDVAGAAQKSGRDPVTGFDPVRFFGFLSADLAARGL